MNVIETLVKNPMNAFIIFETLKQKENSCSEGLGNNLKRKHPEESVENDKEGKIETRNIKPNLKDCALQVSELKGFLNTAAQKLKKVLKVETQPPGSLTFCISLLIKI